MVSVTSADAIIACFDAKYLYTFWRPVTAIRAGGTDGNDATVGDPTWSTLLPGTPNHPEYPSGHSCVTPAAARAVAKFLGTPEIDFTVPSLTGLGDRHFDRVDDLEYEVANARIWGGIHFRSAVEDGVEIAKKTAHQVLDAPLPEVERLVVELAREGPRRRAFPRLSSGGSARLGRARLGEAPAASLEVERHVRREAVTLEVLDDRRPRSRGRARGAPRRRRRRARARA